MIELLLCSVVTILPDFLVRRFVQGKRIGREITLYSVWYELRYGITACLGLTVVLLTLILYFHPSTNSAVSFYRTIPILPEGSGRVEEVYVGLREKVKSGQRLFKLDSSTQEAALETARLRVPEIEAALELAKTELATADARIQEAQSAYQQAVDELATRTELQRRNAGTVAQREIEKLQNIVDGRQAAVSAVLASKQSVEAQIASVLPAQKASAEAALAQAQVELDKTVVYAGVDGTLEQFTLRRGDIVNPFMRPAGVLVPVEAGRKALVAGFDQLEAQVMKVGMVAEATCISMPMTIIPMVVTEVQDLIATGQVRASDQLIDAQQVVRPGTITVFLEPLFQGGFEGVPPGSSCIANAYTNNHDRLSEEGLSTSKWLFFHVIDTVGVVHAVILRIQALLLPVQTLVLSGH
ncbi:MAG: HlyD family secretion protein [Mesorhizobium sp.]|uniref:HlyD family secretion protein n=1 Tax=Mesorhizobium sp. TaxID=1871066 RepID=UPI000FE35AC5|nr:HlyD family secretion protein [Mesorhizobium sp.]RWO04364.1 MAG: HlyD family secretion protein [Mesorhizobium sp.]RWP04170.1 MAG: HlyD family secretion protein [Mesorhizobium sp.]RWP22631.1 MAG: HlyD family secretion protein [Mesorhizobium sp.]RWP31885.1 MAG: HlyD family secretion protein [Mesorhizobium sp.]RWP68119.1 MAG: HlyD family secretion protein [Mesorhizobium sp.]